ncbi:hypothetical protein [Paenibacillus harenae]|nr:hypothetical protein [Paenibacillus harenae]
MGNASLSKAMADNVFAFDEPPQEVVRSSSFSEFPSAERGHQPDA